MRQIFREAEGPGLEKAGIFVRMEEFREYIKKMDLTQFNTLQGQPAANNVCKDSKIANEIERRFGDVNLARAIRETPTGWVGPGRDAVVALIDKRLAQGRDSKQIMEYYNRCKNAMQNLEDIAANYIKLHKNIAEQQQMYEQQDLQSLARLRELIDQEQQIELETLEHMEKKEVIHKNFMKELELLNRALAELKDTTMDVRIWWAKHGDLVWRIIDVVSVLLIVAGPLAYAIATSASLIRRFGFLGKVAKLFSKGKAGIGAVLEGKDYLDFLITPILALRDNVKLRELVPILYKPINI